MKVATILIHLAAALVFAAPALGGESVRIGVSLGPDGKYQGPSRMQRRAYELWRDEVNRRDGLLGRLVELVFRDDGGDAAQAAGIYREFTGREPVDLVFGPYSSALTAAVGPIVDEAGYPMLAAGASADEIWQQGYKNVFGMWTPASRYSQGMLRLALMEGLDRVAILHADDEFSMAIAAGTRKWAPYLNLEVVADEGFAKGTPDLTEYVRQARLKGADLVVVAGHRNEAVAAREAMAAIGWAPRGFFATVGPALPGWNTDMGALADRAFATSIWEPHKSVTYPGSQAFAEAFLAEYKIEPSYHAATAYAAGQILEAAVAQAQSLERDKIRAALFDLDRDSVIGRYAVDHTGMQVKRLEMIVQWQAGRKEIVWPDDIRSARPMFGGMGR
jgi:branched-chain amino acid transport system substrate-binding protein